MDGIGGDWGVGCGRWGEYDAAFHGGGSRIWIDRDAAIYRAPDVRRINGAIPVNGYLKHLRDIRPKAGAQCNATALRLQEVLAPSGSLRRHAQNRAASGVLFEQRESISKRILLCTGRQLVYEAFHDESPPRHAHDTPECSRNTGRLLSDPFDPNIAQAIRQVCGALDSVAVDTVLQGGRSKASHDRRARDPMRPGNRLAVGVECRADAVVVVRAIHVVLNVFFARPDDLDRAADLLCHLNGTDDPVVLEATTETAAEQMVVDANLVQLEAGELRYDLLSHAGDLSADPDVAALLGQLHGAVHLLHRRVRQEWLLVHRIQLVRRLYDARLGVAVMARHGARPFHGRCELCDDIRAGQRCVRPGIPLRRSCGETLLGRPGVDRDDRDGIVQPNHLCDPGYRLRLALVESDQLAAEGRRSRRNREFHSGGLAVDPILRAAVDFSRSVQTSLRRADQLEIRGPLERNILGHWELRSSVHQLPV